MRVGGACRSSPTGTAARGRPQQAVEVAHERRLARAVLADDRDPFAGTDASGRRRRAPALRRDSRSTSPRADDPRHAGSSDRDPGGRPAARRRPTLAPAARRPSSSRRGSPRTSARRSVERDRAASSTTTRVHSARQQVRVVLGDEQRRCRPRPARAARRRRAACPSGSSCAVGSSSTRWRGPSPAGRRPRRAASGRRTAAADRARQAPSMPSASSAADVRRDHLESIAGPGSAPRTRPPRRPCRPPATAASAGFWKQMPTRAASSCIGRSAMSSPSISTRPVERAADRSRRQAAERPGTASSCPPRSRPRHRPPRRRRASGRCRAATARRRPRSGTQTFSRVSI